MTTTDTSDPIQQIGETAGLVWTTLHEQGPLSLAKLTKSVGAPRDVLMQAIGWLAREDKLDFEMSGRTRLVRLKP